MQSEICNSGLQAVRFCNQERRKGVLRKLWVRTILADLLKKCAEHGTAQFLIPDVLKVPSISDRGIARLFGGPEK